MHERLLDIASALSDNALLSRVADLAGRERSSTVELVAHLAELDRRPACLGAGRSLFRHCVEVLRLSEHAAYNRIGAARAARRFPAILGLLADGSVNVTTVTLLAPCLTQDNQAALLREATHKTKDAVKELVRRLDPRPAAKTVVRPVARTAETEVKPARPADEPRELVAVDAPPLVLRAERPPSTVEPRSPDLYRMHLDVDRETREVVRRLQDLLARETGGDISRIFARAARALLKEVEREKLGVGIKRKEPARVEADSRRVPMAVRRAVWRRDAGQCAFLGRGGHRCAERRFLEFHHVQPWALGGLTTVENIALRCRAHNAYEAKLVFGAGHPLGPDRVGPALTRSAAAP